MGDSVYVDGVLTDLSSIFDSPEVAAQSAFNWEKLAGGVLGRWADSEIQSRYQVKSGSQKTQAADGRNYPVGLPDMRIGSTSVSGWIVLAGVAVAGLIAWRVFK